MTAERTLTVASETVVRPVTWDGVAATWDGEPATWQAPRTLLIEAETRTLPVPAEARTLTVTR